MLNEGLEEQREEYLKQTITHEQILLTVFDELGLDPETMSPGRDLVAHLGTSLVSAMRMAKAKGSAEAA